MSPGNCNKDYIFFDLTTNVEQTNEIFIAILDFGDCAWLDVLQVKHSIESSIYIF